MDSEPSIAEVVLHPVRLRIVQKLGGRELTTGALRKELPDITQATLYRHVSALIDAEIVTVVDERRVRGTIERTLALGDIPSAGMFENVYSDPHPLLDEQRAWLEAYAATFEEDPA